MDPQTSTGDSSGRRHGKEFRSTVELVNDEDLLSADAQASLQRIADPLGLLLVVLLVVGSLSRPAQLKRRLADAAVALLPSQRSGGRQ